MIEAAKDPGGEASNALILFSIQQLVCHARRESRISPGLKLLYQRMRQAAPADRAYPSSSRSYPAS